ncbi:O-antigen ligase family protein [Patescibacteria group bacterium]|nr:O-antigen ligase family protein [Patescibacteria group bacterium]
MILWLLFLGLILGQVIKIPLYASSGLTFLDLTVLLSIIFLLITKKFKPYPLPIFIYPIVAFVLSAFVSLLLSPLGLNKLDSIVSLGYLVRWGMYLLLGWLILQRPDLKTRVPLLIIYSGFILTILGFFQLIIFPDLLFLQSSGWDPHFFRMVSTLLDPNFLGVYLVLSLISLVSYPELIKHNKLLRIFFIVIFIGVITTFSRGTIIMFFVSFLALTILRKSTKLLGLTLILTLVLGLSYLSYDKFVAAPRNINKTQSAAFRANSWQEGLEIFQLNPILGVGFNSYRYALNKYQLAPTDYINSRSASGNDSSLLFVAATTGVIGLIFYLGFLTTIIFTGYKSYLQKNKAGILLLAGLGGLLINSFVINSLFYPWILLWLSLNLQDYTFKNSDK